MDAALKGRTNDRNENNNYGGVELYMREPDDNDGEQSIVSIFKFDTSDLDNYKEIREAKLRLRVSNVLDNQGAVNISAWSTTGSTKLGRGKCNVEQRTAEGGHTGRDDCYDK